MKVSVVTDEISSDPETALEITASWGVKFVEIRAIGDQRFPEVADYWHYRLRQLVREFGQCCSRIWTEIAFTAQSSIGGSLQSLWSWSVQRDSDPAVAPVFDPILVHRGRVIRPICGGEAARNVVVISASRARGSGVRESRITFREQQYFVPDPTRASHRGMYAVRFEPSSTPKYYEAVAGGTAYLYKGEGDAVECTFDEVVNPPEYDGTYVFNSSVDEYGLVVLLIAPERMTISSYTPDPVMAKLSPDHRVAIAWAFYGEPGQAPRTAMTKWTFAPLRVDSHLAVKSILKHATTRNTPAGRTATRLALVDEHDLQRVKDAYKADGEEVPAWFPKAGAGFAVATFLSLFYLLIAGPDLSARQVVFDAWMAFCLAASAAFIGGTAASKGRIPIPWLQEAPIQFSAYGGIAVFVIVFLLLRTATP